VEEALYIHPEVQEAAVFGCSRPAVEGVGDGIGSAEQRAGGHRRRAYCALPAASPNYEKPRLIHFVPELPKSAGGTVLRRELEAQYRQVIQ
jgi:acyl-coenzyme A synthetase/AMP-(fatty) acid ligase